MSAPECCCQNPAGKGVRGLSNCCPVHNENPMPPVHGCICVAELHRCSETLARSTIQIFLQDHVGNVPFYNLDADGDRCWSFWVKEDDTTSYLHPDLRIEWYGTSWAPNDE